jgi:drug/metabolite transporter (DMT)-like permease
VLSTSQILVATVEVGIVAALFTHPPANVQPQSVAAVVALGALGTGIAYILNYSLLRDAGATITTTVTYLLPIVAVIAGVVLLNEPLTWNEPVGAAIIIAGAVIAQGRPSWLGRRATAASPDPERPPDADTMAA